MKPKPILDLRMARYLILLGLALVSQTLSAGVTCAPGGTCEQRIPLHPGWNAIYLQVEPAVETLAEAFASVLDDDGPKLESVWTWVARPTRIEFIRDQTTEDLLAQPGWLRFFPESSGKAFLTNLFTAPGNRAYLVKLAGTASTDLVVTGKPLPPSSEWEPNAFNFTGFHVDETIPPSFSDFLAASSAHAGQPVYQLRADGIAWEAIDPLTTLIEPGRAYWVWCQGGSDYVGPLSIDRGETLSYGSRLESQPLILRSHATTALDITLAALNDGGPLRYANPDSAAETPWLPLPLATQVAAGAVTRQWLGIRRAEITTATYGDTLEIRVPGMTRWLIPVTAAVVAPAATAGRAAQAAEGGPMMMNGLWVGAVTIDEVSQANNYAHDCDSDGENPGTGTQLCTDEDGFPVAPLDAEEALNPVDPPFQFRLILHQDADGQVRLLKDVIQMWKDGVGEEPGHLVLLTDDTLIPHFSGVDLRDGQTVGRRLSTAAYDFPGETLVMARAEDGTLSATLELTPESPTNPFRHRYHPAHDGLAADYQTPNDEVYTVTRTLRLRLESSDEGGLDSGYGAHSGTYEERVEGLHKHPIVAKGAFILNNVSSVEVLNDGQ